MGAKNDVKKSYQKGAFKGAYILHSRHLHFQKKIQTLNIMNIKLIIINDEIIKENKLEII